MVEEKRAQKRQQILNAAMRVFAEKGFYHTKVSDIAQAAEVAHGTVYLYFETKEELLLQIFEEKMDELIEYVRDEIGREPNAESKLRRLITIQMNLIETNPDLTELLLLEARQSGKFLRSTAIDKIACYCSLLEDVLREGVEEGWIRPELDLHVAATVLYCGIEGIATRWVLENKRGSLEETAKAIIDLFIQGVRNPRK